MNDRMLRAASRVQCHPAVAGIGVAVFIVVILGVSTVHDHAAEVARDVRYALAVILVSGAAGLTALVTTAVSRQPVHRHDELEPDMAPLPAHDGSTWSRHEEHPVPAGEPAAHAAVIFPTRVIPPEKARSDRSEVPR